MFYLYKEKLILDEGKVEVPSMKKLIKDHDKGTATSMCLFVFLVADRSDENPLKDLPESEREVLAAKASNLDVVKYGKLMKPIIKDYKKAHMDRIQRDIDLYDKKMEQFQTLLEETTPELVKNTSFKTGKISFTTNTDIITDILKNIINIIIYKASVVGMKKSGKFIQNLRGGLTPNSKGKLKVK